MKKIIYSISLLFFLTACNSDLLDLQSLTEPTDATFFSNQEELDLALNGVYNSLIWRTDYALPAHIGMDNGATDIGLVRGNFTGFDELGAGSHSANSGGFLNNYSHLYRGVARANNLISNLDRASASVAAEQLMRIKAEAMVLRAFFYSNLVFLFGDVPYTEEVVTNPSDGLLPRVNKEEVINNILSDLQEAAQILPKTALEKNRIFQDVALILHSRVALFAGRYREAAESSRAVIDGGNLFLHPNYEELFTPGGEGSREAILTMPFKDGFGTLPQFSVAQGSRNYGSFSVVVPTQSMIDSYEAIDGLPIDQSTVYNPTRPFDNRDPRLKASIVTPQSIWGGIIFESHLDSLEVRNADGTLRGRNNDSRRVIWPAAFCGYLWKKYTNVESQLLNRGWSETDFILVRYTEALLNYAEAKIELDEIDPSVHDALNRVRARAYGVSVDDVANYPAVTSLDKSFLRTLIKRERKVEFANEGFRLYDIRRWQIAHKVMPVKLYGRILDEKNARFIPSIDADGFVSYAGIESQYDLNTDQRFPNAVRVFTNPRDYLLPIPQAEIDTYKANGVVLPQNPGGY
ncbi:Starch-binding associating with outer membrane [Aquiflexum balticum DSM 16537]|uniref:Starch-binding associating with outer membrane n=1 Tax=Aquiflexum balticum DSM 16537 TaxID=758820 RepID=A0A1W2H403_9BACT|nr:RagB/SusD family nutrient uptake outer membrane protein [Aquiflexum balticum]SMD43660.1 Starch-binding associating with outer membrane [Aquiflexum balticum DSM 16537]